MTNADQREYWNSPTADRWLEYNDALDTLMAGIRDVLVERAAPQPGETVLDVGCGAGDTTLHLARRVTPGGHALGVDVSAQLLGRARERLAIIGFPATFLQADAQTHPFDRPFELIMSRFGVMFFDDPVAAFANLRAAMAPGARLVIGTWSAREANPWFDIPGRIAADRLGAPQPQSSAGPHEPGPMAFADIAAVCAILSGAGLADAAGEAVPVPLTFEGSSAEIGEMATRIGPATRVLREMEGTEDDRKAVASDIADAFAKFATGDRVEVPAVINIFTARQG